MRNNSWIKVALVVMTCVMPLAAQEPTLKGKVISAEDPQPRNWGGVKIRVNKRPNNSEVGGEQKVTKDQDWYHVAPLAAHVDVLFDKVCYVPDGLYAVYVSQ